MADPEAQARYEKLFSAELGILLKKGNILLNQIVSWFHENDVEPEQIGDPLFKVDVDPKTGERHVHFICRINEKEVRIPPVPEEQEPDRGPRTPRRRRPVDDPEAGTVQGNPVQESMDRRN